ncbi:MAG: AsmA family protein [Pseudomonadota bacterium]
MAAILLAAFPWGVLKGPAERALSRRLDRPVTIGTLRRVDRFSFTPTIELTDLRIPQAAWAGKGDVVRIRRAVVTVPLATILRDGLRTRSVAIEGMALDFVRAVDGRESWREQGRADDGGGGVFSTEALSITDSRLLYRDARRRRSVDAAIVATHKGLTLEGRGKVRGAPVLVSVRTAAIGGDARWPFHVAITGQALTMAAKGSMDRPLDVHHLDMDITAKAANLSYIDAVIEAGLPRTQPVELSAHARRDGPDWTISRLNGTIGRSDLMGEASIRKRDGRHIIDGSLRSRRFDFDDLADDRGRAAAREKRWRFGPRVFPDTAIDLDNLRNTDGALRVHAARLLWPGPSPFRSLDGTIRLSRRVLTIDDLRMGLTHGSMTGKVRVDHPANEGPVLALDLKVKSARIVDFAPDTQIDGRIEGRLHLTGPGATIRAAIGRSTGMIGIVGRDGALPARTAALLGQDLLGGVLASKKEQAQLRCAIIRLDASGGIATADPILIDTTRGRTEIAGRIMLAEERLALEMRGMPKQHADLRLIGPILITGTLKEPSVALPAKGGVVGNLLKSVGRALDDKDMPVAVDADCAGLAARALSIP